MEEYLHDQNEKISRSQKEQSSTHCTTQYFLISCQPSILELSHICITKNTSSRSLSSLLNINKYRCVLNVALTKVQQIHYTHIRLLSQVMQHDVLCSIIMAKWILLRVLFANGGQMGYLESPKNRLKVEPGFSSFWGQIFDTFKTRNPSFRYPIHH